MSHLRVIEGGANASAATVKRCDSCRSPLPERARKSTCAACRRVAERDERRRKREAAREQRRREREAARPRCPGLAEHIPNETYGYCGVVLGRKNRTGICRGCYNTLRAYQSTPSPSRKAWQKHWMRMWRSVAKAIEERSASLDAIKRYRRLASNGSPAVWLRQNGMQAGGVTLRALKAIAAEPRKDKRGRELPPLIIMRGNRVAELLEDLLL